VELLVVCNTREGLDFPLVDFHVHLDNSTIEKVLDISQERGVRFGIVEHTGTKENKYPTLISSDAELERYLAMLRGKPVYCGIQAEWIDWIQCFSMEKLLQLDFVLSDAMTFPGKHHRRTKLWEKDVELHVDLSDEQAFMDQYVDWHLQIMAKEPIDILANTSWLPARLAANYDILWTLARMQKIIDAARKNQIALEISSSYRLPKIRFLELAKAAGVKFSFGSNGRFPNMGRLDYCIAMAKELGLTQSDMFIPARMGDKPVQRRKLT